jgi:hypothetical protein
MSGMSKKQIAKNMVMAGCTREQIQQALGLKKTSLGNGKLYLFGKEGHHAFASVELPKEYFEFYSSARTRESAAFEMVSSSGVALF